MFEILEHTADIGFRARARTLAQLFEEAAQAMLSIVMDPNDVAPAGEDAISAKGSDREALLVNWLGEVLYRLDGERLAFHHFRVDRVTKSEVSGAGIGQPRDPERHHTRLIVKGVTYHQLRVSEDSEG